MATRTRKIRNRATDSRLDLASYVSDRVEIQNVHLLETRAKRGRIRDKMPGSLQFSVQVLTKVNQTKSMLAVQPRLTLVAKYDDAEDGDEALRIEASYSLAYALKSAEGLTSDHFDAFGGTNGLYNAWPFWREYVQATTARLGLPALTIPVLPPIAAKQAAADRTATTAKPARTTRKKRNATGKA